MQFTYYKVKLRVMEQTPPPTIYYRYFKSYYKYKVRNNDLIYFLSSEDGWKQNLLPFFNEIKF